MKTLEDLLEIDASCAKESLLVFAELPGCLDCANAGLRVFEEASRWMSEYEADNPAQVRFDQAAKELGLSGQDLLAAIRSPAAPHEPNALTQARGADRDIAQLIGCRTLLQLAYRSYRSALTDFRRFKLTSAAGHLRVEAESAVLIRLFQDEPEFAERWLNPKEDMRRFFIQAQPLVKKRLTQYDLLVAYEHGSAVAQHPRFASAARGIRLDGNSVTVLDQEFDPEDPVTFHLALAYFLKMQARIFALLADTFTHLASDSGFTEAVRKYAEFAEKTWWVLERRYRSELESFQV
jgi:hypothetical protein